MAKRLTVDKAFEWLHQENLEGKVVWNAEYHHCFLHVLVGGEICGIFGIYNGCIEEGEKAFGEIMDCFSQAKPHLTLVAS